MLHDYNSHQRNSAGVCGPGVLVAAIEIFVNTITDSYVTDECILFQLPIFTFFLITSPIVPLYSSPITLLSSKIVINKVKSG